MAKELIHDKGKHNLVLLDELTAGLHPVGAIMADKLYLPGRRWKCCSMETRLRQTVYENHDKA
ncbi:hypothetical protein ACE3MS_22615 [Paenibacillus dendritiformis]|uniref:hypothetical protein n=1 Tax=Paenibacillus dendritiformis TaxID=130049 RepID=UPI003669A7F1